jgi:hypothetical protein
MGGGLNRWPAVHRLCCPSFSACTREDCCGGKFHGVADEGVPFRHIAEVIGRRLNMPGVTRSPEEAAIILRFAHFAAIDNPALIKLTQGRLGWRPVHPALIPDLNAEHYFKI